MFKEITTAVLQSEWIRLLVRLWSMLIKPVAHLPFVGYAVLVVFFGGLGVWVEWFKHYISKSEPEISGLITAILTFFPAIVGPAAVQLVFYGSSKADKSIMMFGILTLCTFSVAAIYLAEVSRFEPQQTLVTGIWVCVAGFIVWWIANGEDPNFRNSPPPDAASGGSTKQALSGDLTGFKS